jgi:hypothetical protein
LVTNRGSQLGRKILSKTFDDARQSAEVAETTVKRRSMMPDKVRKWLRQQSKHFYAAGFDALVKRWDKCISVSGGYVEK